MSNTKSRNAKGNGSFRQRPDGSWEGRCTIAGKRRSFYGKRQKDVILAMRAAQKQADDGVFLEPKRIAFHKWLDTWLEEYVRPSCKPLTYAAYKSRVDVHIKPALGSTNLCDLNATQIQAFLNRLTREKGLSPKSVRNVHGVLHKSLEQAYRLRYIGINPADLCTLPRAEKHKITPLTEPEIHAFLGELQKGEPLADLFTLTLFTGMREGEVCGLDWESVNFAAGSITVRQQLCKEKQRGGKYYIGKTKNDRARVQSYFEKIKT